MSIEIDIPDLPTLAPSAEHGQAAVGAYRDAVVERTRQGIAPDGSAFGTHRSSYNRGQRIDLFETGRMLTDWTTDASGESVRTTTQAPYAGYVQDRYGWANPDDNVSDDVTDALDGAVTRDLEDQ